MIGEGESITENTNTYGFLEFALNYGDPWDGERPQALRPLRRHRAVELRRQDPDGSAAHPGRPLHEAARGRTAPLPRPAAGLRLHRQRGLRVRRAEPRARRCSRSSEPSSTLRLFTRLQALRDPARGGELRLLRSSPTSPTRSATGSTTTARASGGAVELYLQRKNLPARHRPLPLQLHRRVERLDLQRRDLERREDRPRLGPRRPPAQREAGGPAHALADDRRGRLDLLPPQPLRRHRSDTPEFGEAGRQTITQRNPEARLFLAWNYNH